MISTDVHNASNIPVASYTAYLYRQAKYLLDAFRFPNALQAQHSRVRSPHSVPPQYFYLCAPVADTCTLLSTHMQHDLIAKLPAAST